MTDTPPVTDYQDEKTYRLIPSKYPPIDLYEDIAEPNQLEAVYAIEAITNPRIGEVLGQFEKVPVHERLVGIPHCSYVMAAFTHINPEGARFSTGDFSAYYCAPDIKTSIKETAYHCARIMRYTKEPAQSIDMRSLVATFSGSLTNITDEPYTSSALYHPESYSASQAFAREIKGQGADGVVYQSVRHQGHVCYALYKPNLVSKICQGAHYEYQWNGETINHIFKKALVKI